MLRVLLTSDRVCDPSPRCLALFWLPGSIWSSSQSSGLLLNAAVCSTPSRPLRNLHPSNSQLFPASHRSTRMAGGPSIISELLSRPRPSATAFGVPEQLGRVCRESADRLRAFSSKPAHATLCFTACSDNVAAAGSDVAYEMARAFVSNVLYEKIVVSRLMNRVDDISAACASSPALARLVLTGFMIGVLMTRKDDDVC